LHKASCLSWSPRPLERGLSQGSRPTTNLHSWCCASLLLRGAWPAGPFAVLALGSRCIGADQERDPPAHTDFVPSRGSPCALLGWLALVRYWLAYSSAPFLPNAQKVQLCPADNLEVPLSYISELLYLGCGCEEAIVASNFS
jgi:hypothetical protein